uniref:Protein transport protein sec16 n=1 Tax=Strongyloides papillosus TaxID=174720 RepID=A0A0N5BET9_STREA
MASKRAYENVLNGTENEHTPLTPRTVALPRKRVNTSQSRHPLTNQNFSGVDDGVDETKQSCEAFNESGSSSISQDKPVPVSSPEEKYTSNSQSNVSFPTRLFSVESTPFKDKYDGNLTSGTQGNNDSTICFSPGALYKSNPPTADRNISVVSTSYSYSYSFTGLFSTPNAHGQDNSILSKNGSEMATFNDSSNPGSGEDLFEVISSQTGHVDAPPVEDASVDASIHSSLVGVNDTSTSFPSNTQMFSANRGSTQEYKDCDAESLIGYSRDITNVSSVSMAPFENTQETTGNDTSLVNMEDSELKSEAGNNSGEAVVLSNSPHILHGGHDVSENNDTTTGNDSVNLPSSSNNLDASVDNVTKTNVLDISIKKENPNESIFSQANNSVNITIPNLFNEGSPSTDNIGTSMDIGHDNVAIKLELSSTTSETYHCVLENDKSTNNVEEEMAVETAKTTDSLVSDECISIVHVQEEVSSSEDQMVVLDKSGNSPVSDHMDVETHSSSTPSRISNNDLPVKSNLDRSTYSNSQNVSRICDVSHDSTTSSRNVGDDVNCVNRSTVFDDSNSCMASNVTTCTLLPEYSSSSLQINDTVSNSTSEVGNVTVAGDVLAVMNDLKHNVSTLSDSCSKKTDGTYLDLLD